MEAGVVVSVSPYQQWSGSTGDPGHRRYRHVFCHHLSHCDVKVNTLVSSYPSYDNIITTKLITEVRDVATVKKHRQQRGFKGALH